VIDSAINEIYYNCVLTRLFSGERCNVKLAKLLAKHVNRDCRIWNLCGPAETTLQSLFHQVTLGEDTDSIPLGKPLPNYYCIVQDTYKQPVIIDQEGELLMAGVGIFTGYLGRDDLTKKALIEIDGEIFYRTGDLVRMDHNGLLHYQGRKDHQIKLHGQRIELGEIEGCLLKTSISACVVMKWDDAHLVAYVQTSEMNEEQLRQHCLSYLPPHMIPSIFILMEKLPLNANGKIDRKQLLGLNFGSLSLPTTEDWDEGPNDAVERQIQAVWCEILQRTHISINTNFFRIGGHSLLFIELYRRYKSIFELNTHSINMTELIESSTIADHARVIRYATNRLKCETVSWFLLRFSSGKFLQRSRCYIYSIFGSLNISKRVTFMF
jgi:hypothetical protein